MLKSIGFKTIYNQTYGYEFKDTDISDLKNYCTFVSILCVGGGKAGDDNMLLVACGDCFSVLAVTELNKPNNVGSVYWYYTPKISFGFAPTSSISQNNCDSMDLDNKLRLCWNINWSYGAGRLGNIRSLESSSAYSKYVFVKRNKNE